MKYWIEPAFYVVLIAIGAVLFVWVLKDAFFR